MKRKGFTLIELLAVIVILAIIALIATPLVLNTIEKARKGAAVASAYSYVDEVERYVMLSQLDTAMPKLQSEVEYQLSSTPYEGMNLTTILINDLVELKGDKPDSGYVIINSNGTIKKAEMIINRYPIECKNNKCRIIGSRIEDKQEPEIQYPSVLEKAKALVYDENGICKNDDTTYNYMGGCYIKGENTSNYVWYNGFMWRIMGINSDGTIRLITDEAVTVMAYSDSTVERTYLENKGHIHDWLNEYFYNNLNSTKSIIQNGAYFCSESTNEETLTEGRQTCTSGNEVTAKIGIISLDEYVLSDASTSYLNIDEIFWTMTPYNGYYAWYLNTYGEHEYDGSPQKGVRPVINVSDDANITAGDGSAQSFYVLEENKENNVTGKLSEKATSGEYVRLEDHTYRIVNKNNNGVKLILDGFYEEEDVVYKGPFGDDVTFNLESGIGHKLNTDVLTWLGLSTSDKIVEATYYQGDGIAYGETYQDNLKQSNGVDAKVGLIQMGDILASQSSTMLTKNYTKLSSVNNTDAYWLMNKCGWYDKAWEITWGRANDTDPTYDSGLRPVITLRNDLNITSGTGTWKNPYQI